MEDLRKKIDEKTGCEYMKCTDFKKGVCYYKYPYCKYRPEEDLFPSLEGILVEEECNNCGGDGSFYNQGMPHAKVKCGRCKGTGKIRRPVTLEDIDIYKIINELTVCKCHKVPLLESSIDISARNIIVKIDGLLTTKTGGILVIIERRKK